MSRTGGRILVVDDEDVLAATLREFLQREGFEVATAANVPDALARLAEFEPDLALCDIQLPGLDGLELLDRLLRVRPETMVVMMTAYATVETAVAAFRRGAHDYLMKPVHFDELLAKVGRLLESRRLWRQNQALRRQLHAEEVVPETLVGASAAMREVRALIRKVGPTRANVLLTGESGTGKELAARALHALGPKDEPFLAVNCAAIPHDLMEGQLFGHVRGAFTGADRDHAGLFVAAGRGTVFLDEIGELAQSTQAKLLRAIEAKDVLPIGATRPSAFDARVIAATNKDFPAEIAAGRFRADLYYRLNVITIPLPPLRGRPEDVPELIAVLLARHARRLGRRVDGVDNDTVRRLMAAPWRGNVRELDNALERAVILGDSPILTPADFPAELVAADAPGDDLRAAVARFERRHIEGVLAACGGDKREAARRLGLGLSSLYRKLDEEGPSDLDPRGDLTPFKGA